MPKRLTVHMVKGSPHVLDFESDEKASAALKEINDAMAVRGPGQTRPVTVAGLLVVRPADVRSAELGDEPQAFIG